MANKLIKIRIDCLLGELESVSKDLIKNLKDYELIEDSEAYPNRDGETGRIYLSFIKR